MRERRNVIALPRGEVVAPDVTVEYFASLAHLGLRSNRPEREPPDQVKVIVACRGRCCTTLGRFALGFHNTPPSRRRGCTRRGSRREAPAAYILWSFARPDERSITQ